MIKTYIARVLFLNIIRCRRCWCCCCCCYWLPWRWYITFVIHVKQSAPCKRLFRMILLSSNPLLQLFALLILFTLYQRLYTCCSISDYTRFIHELLISRSKRTRGQKLTPFGGTRQDYVRIVGKNKCLSRSSGQLLCYMQRIPLCSPTPTPTPTPFWFFFISLFSEC